MAEAGTAIVSRGRNRWLAAVALSSLAATPAAGQTCYFLPRAAAEEAVALLPSGTILQSYCAPCRDRRATRVEVDTLDIQPIDSWSVRLIMNGGVADLASLYIFDPKRRRWRNLGLLTRCHEEDDVPLTLPADKLAG